MISCLSFEYAYARTCAGLAQRPDEPLWARLRSAHSVAALLELVRGSAAAALVSGVSPAADGDVIELAFRQQLRSRIDEFASWLPENWRDAVLFTRHLPDLPSVVHLQSDESPPSWWYADPVLGFYARMSPAERHAAIDAGPLASIVRSMPADSPPRTSRTDRAAATGKGRVPPLHRVLAEWRRQWRSLWPQTSTEASNAMGLVEHTLEQHVRGFGTLSVSDAQAARQTVSARLATLLRRSQAQPAAFFAYLAVFALDLERLRAEFVRRARPVGDFR